MTFYTHGIVCQSSVERLERAKGSSRWLQPSAFPATDRHQHGVSLSVTNTIICLSVFAFVDNPLFTGDLLLCQDSHDVRHLERHDNDPLVVRPRLRSQLFCLFPG